MIRSEVKTILETRFAEGVKKGLWSERAAGKFVVELPKHQGQGDFSTNFALVLAGIEKQNPRQIAAELKNQLERDRDIIERVEIAGPGFVNMYIRPTVWQALIPRIIDSGVQFGRSNAGGKRRVMVEFVSANPTGPLSIGHGRQAILGDAIARLLEATGHDVFREYYYNDAGRQMRVLGESTRARYLELLGEESSFPEDGYQGSYIIDIAKGLQDSRGASLKAEEDVTPFKEEAEKYIFTDISGTLQRMGIVFDNYYNERDLYENGQIDDVVENLREKGLVYDRDGAVWLRTRDLGLDQDRVIIKSSGEPTYRLPDIAYHREKFKRGFDWLVNVMGSDHIATVPDVLAGVQALGFDPEKVTVVLHQFVTLTRDGKQVKMSTRKANFVTIDELLDEVGIDPVRFFFTMRKADSQMEFDLELATRQSQENPVYYVQYAHARLCSIMRQAQAQGAPLVAGEADLSLLVEPEELNLLKTVSGFPQIIETSALELAPHKVIFYLMELSAQLHSYYNKHKVLTDDLQLSRARLQLIYALQIVLKNALGIVGVTAPERM
ncbi:MAG: arginine--tRNA ligase [Deltaproteobacteria bacterium]|nr:MAG: arginine--tRNA ligase [Deltaproteobacteria bacterium]PIE73143.1 MAG: arginine--tRNA ligase [Deltaproteobacteria bacterium]